MTIGINASRARSGGGVKHLIKILENFPFEQKEFSNIHIWGHEDILKKIPENNIFFKHIAFSHSRGLLYQIFWERFKLPIELKTFKCDVLINIDAGSFCDFLPSITMSRDMLSYEKNIMKKYFFSVQWLRLFILKYVQIWSLKNATYPVFLTEYARNIIQSYSGNLLHSVLIPHGVDIVNLNHQKRIKYFDNSYIEILYVSNFDLYKHQDNVISAFNLLSKKYPTLRLHLVGGDNNDSFYHKCKRLAHKNNNIFFHGNVDHTEINNYLFSADILLFASSCENMPNTLLEYMAAKKPILCSERGPMPEVLGDWDFYFDPENVPTIVNAISNLINQRSSWVELSTKSYERVQKYSWQECSKSIFNLALMAKK